MLINNTAADEETGHNTIERVTQKVIDGTFSVNVKGGLFMIREFV